MKLHLGIKSDPIEYRYGFEWLFSYMARREIAFLQLGSFFELYHLPDDYFRDLKSLAADHGVRIKSCFTAHRELGGFFTGNRHLETVARRCYERYVEVASLVGADYVGSNPGAVYRDRMESKEDGIRRYIDHMLELSGYAREWGLAGLTMEPMSSVAEPPTTPEEIRRMIRGAGAGYERDPASYVPVYVCGDVSHGLIDRNGTLVHDHESLFEYAIPWMVEFHLKNTDGSYHSTFGFGPADRARGVVDLGRIREIVYRNRSRWPVGEVVAYLEIGGPKLGRDYSDPMLEDMLDESIEAIRNVFAEL